MLGYKHSEETKRKISESKKGHLVAKETREKIQMTLQGNIPWNRGKKGIYSSETKEKIRRSLKGNKYPNKGKFVSGHKTWNKGVECLQISEEKHWNWKGNKVGYSGLHGWVYRQLGAPKKCDRCDSITSKKYHWANRSGKYMRDIKDWERLCVKCHINDHKPWEARWQI